MMTKTTDDLPALLRQHGAGRYVWRVQEKTTRAIRIEFEDYERHEAEKWWKEYSTKYPESYEGYELARVLKLCQQDKLMQQAADYIEALEAGLKGQPCKSS